MQTRRSLEYGGGGIGGGTGDYGNRYGGSAPNQYNRHHDSRSRGSSSFHPRESSHISQRSRERMGPPKNVSMPTARRIIRGSATSSTYRGRGGIGMRGSSAIRRGSRMSTVTRPDVRLKRRLLPARTQESIRKLKLARLRRYCI